MKWIIVFLGNSLYQSFMQHYSEVSDNEHTDQMRLATRYLCFEITGFVEHWLAEDRISLEEAQRQLDICTRDIFRNLRDMLI